jgi:hypothetical protein
MASGTLGRGIRERAELAGPFVRGGQAPFRIFMHAAILTSPTALNDPICAAIPHALAMQN